MATSDAPISISTITLIVNNLEKVASFYEKVLGLNVLTKDGPSCTLGQADTALVHLQEDQSAKFQPREAGLFHTAFLLPDRVELGSWLKHVNDQGVQLEGAADHSVSEAIYLSDPEGNGVEVYVDRDRSHWTIHNELIKLETKPLNLKKLAATAKTRWGGLPDGSVIGHVHLQVGDVDVADAFYRDKLGMARTAHMSGASFYGSGGYHHQLAANTWNSRDAQHRPTDTTGLYELELKVEDPDFDLGTEVDPWGIRLRLSTA